MTGTSEGKVRLVEVPWARSRSGFTLLFEALTMALIESDMPLNKVGKLLGENAIEYGRYSIIG